MNQMQPYKALVIEADGRYWTTSLIIAQHFEKDHKNILQSIDNLECSIEFTRLNFQLSDYKDPSGRNNKMYLITRDGFMYLAMGFTGSKAATLKERFIEAFNDATRPKSSLDMFALSVKVAQEHDRRLTTVEQSVTALEDRTQAKLQEFEQKMAVDKVNQFPEGCSINKICFHHSVGRFFVKKISHVKNAIELQ